MFEGLALWCARLLRSGAFTMNKIKRHLRTLVAVLAILGFFSASYLSVSVVTARESQAQVCSNLVCMGLFDGLGRALSDVWKFNLPISALYATASITMYYGVEMASFAVKTFQQINLNIAHWVSWWDTLWFYGLNPALQDMTRQLTVLDIDQARMIASFNDMVDRSNVLARRQQREIESRQRHMPSEGVCAAGTISVGLGRLDDLSSAYFSASLREFAARGAGYSGTSGAGGTAEGLAHDMRAYRDRYCFAGEDGGAICGDEDAPYAGKDRDVAGLFEEQTLDLKDPNVQEATKALVENLSEPLVPPKIPRFTTLAAQGQGTVLYRQAANTARDVARAAVVQAVADRAPAGEGAFVDEVREAAGLPPTGPEGVSKVETMDALANQRGGALGVMRSSSGEAALVKEEIVNAGVLLRQNIAILGLYQRAALVAAGRVGMKVSDQYRATGKVDGQ